MRSQILSVGSDLCERVLRKWRQWQLFMVWTEGEDNLKTFIHYLNSIHSTIKFTHEFSNSLHQTLPFLDVQVHLDNKQIQTDLHTKPTDKHQYLLKTSCHPAHTKGTIPFSLALRLRRICSTDIFFSKRCQELINFLQSRGYSRRFLKTEINRVSNIPRQETLKPRPQNNDSVRTPFAITYTPALPNVSTVTRKNVNILQSSTRCQQTFPSPLIVAYKRSPNLRDLLVKTLCVTVLHHLNHHLAFLSVDIRAASPVHSYSKANSSTLFPPPKKNDVSLTP